MSSALIIAFGLLAIAVLQGMLLSGWSKGLIQPLTVRAMDETDLPRLTVLIPMRDEADHIAALLQSIHAQSYPMDRVEVVVVNDSSSDRSVAIVEGMQIRWPALRIISSEGRGKKAAITTGIAVATHEIIVLSDADTRCGPLRLRRIAESMRETQADLVIAPVWTEGSGILGGLQEEEQAALLGVAMGSADSGSPLLAYGSNMAFRKKAFHAVGGYHGDRYASGDDHFLLQRMRMNGKRVSALLHPDALVMTSAVNTWREFLSQRLRWAGKMRGSSNLLSFLGLLWPWLLLGFTVQFSFTRAIGDHALYQVLLIAAAWLLWIIPVLGLVSDVRKAMHRQGSAMRTLLALLCFTAYAPVIAVLSRIIRPRWKGRRL